MRKLMYSICLVLCCSLVGCSSHKEDAAAPMANHQDAAQINTRLGLAYLNQGNFPRAKEKLLLAVQQKATSQTYGALAYFYERTHDNKLAHEYYQKAIDLNSKNGAPHNNFGAFLCRQGEYQAAENQFQLAVSDPHYINSAGAYENAGLCALLIPNKAKAGMYFNKAIQQNPKLPTSLHELAQLNNEDGHYQQALLYFNQYIMLKEPDAATLWLGVEIAKNLNDKSAMQRYGRMLQNSYPHSTEYAQYMKIEQ